MKYYRTFTTAPIEDHMITTEKAICLTMNNGWGQKPSYIWLPKSQIIFGEVNDVGNIPMWIPMWLLKDIQHNVHRIEELDLDIIEER